MMWMKPPVWCLVPDSQPMETVVTCNKPKRYESFSDWQLFGSEPDKGGDRHKGQGPQPCSNEHNRWMSIRNVFRESQVRRIVWMRTSHSERWSVGMHYNLNSIGRDDESDVIEQARAAEFFDKTGWIPELIHSPMHDAQRHVPVRELYDCVLFNNEFTLQKPSHHNRQAWQ